MKARMISSLSSAFVTITRCTAASSTTSTAESSRTRPLATAPRPASMATSPVNMPGPKVATTSSRSLPRRTMSTLPASTTNIPM